MVHLKNNFAPNVQNAHSNSRDAFLHECHAYFMHKKGILLDKFSL